MARRARRLTVLAVAAALVAGACGDDSASSDAGDASDVGDGAAGAVSEAWARSSPAGVTAGAAYLTITSASDDQLVGVSVLPTVAARAEIHETIAGDDHDMGAAHGTDGDAGNGGTTGVMTMQPVSAIDLPAGETVTFDPGGLHVMLLDLAEPLETGSTFELVLTFARAGPLTVTVEIRDDAP